MVSLILGGTGMVGSYIFDHLARTDEEVISLSRHPRRGQLYGDVTQPDTLRVQHADTIYCATNPRPLSRSLPHLLEAAQPERLVVISSTSVFSKVDSRDTIERQSIAELIQAESAICEECERRNVAWTILRPTLIYSEGRDRNISQIARVIRRIRCFPLYGAASGLRQPVHAEDLAIGAIAAAKSKRAANRAYCTTGTETLTYREMAGRVFDSLSIRRRLVSLPPMAWKAAFWIAKPVYPHVTSVMGERMNKDLAFDFSPAIEDFGWRAREFRPVFRAGVSTPNNWG
ncbi:Conserved protein of unknown function; putative NAD-dependent epimerase/dehydratase [Bradyrhizobium sp. ORS 285]|uniref:NAD-dependent epimerase/dehydratase family protein n=1 Tax=Bradyrhizobium sp. ORS 285 TaxID=115808 RepID=UPI000240AC7A|nr:NAD-dependent epimerase/dehydratase family protein [Bradyrhizobium sp. ORS 285]CCD89992.1 Conserved hypothetical protein; putative NAD-dependent epimerase/dehydratase [Bradyrhizobium sp. ORS 285]SMX61276.1 Conserved protein of unknown function; putative NAD-dependent epimerase/dehydratase [Bradyrhizobium sp. ORS 285]